MRSVRSIIPLTVILALGAGVACQKPAPVVQEQKPVTPLPPTPEEVAVQQKADAEAVRLKAEAEAEAARKAKAAAEAEAAIVRKKAEEAAQAAAVAALKDINFDFDKSDIREVDKVKLQGVADYLKAYPAAKLMIEGHCDERGTVEYNQALSEKRAHAALAYLVSLGVAETRLESVGFGKEKPKVTGHDEQSWLENRRCEFRQL
jgi:peptidoglycan-associated lipoprotein